MVFENIILSLITVHLTKSHTALTNAHYRFNGTFSETHSINKRLRFYIEGGYFMPST